MRGSQAPALARVACRALGAVLLAVPFLPLRRLFGSLQGAGALVPPREWGLGIVVFGLSAWLMMLVAVGRLEALGRWPRLLEVGGQRTWIVGGLTALTVLLVSASTFAFRHSPLLVDSVVQLFQAKIFASGDVAAPAPPGGGFFVTQHMIVDGGRWYSQYPPGHPALLAAGVIARIPWLVPIIISVASAALIYRAAERMYGLRCARITLLLLVICPFFWFMGASHMNHVSSLFFISGFLYLFVRWEDGGSWVWAAGAGAALGAAALCRPLTAAAAAVPFLAFALASEHRRHVTVAAVGFAAVASIYLVYNARLTGDPFVPGYIELWGESHGLGFHETPWGARHTLLAGLRNELLDLALLDLYLFEWPVPALLPVGASFAAGWTLERWDRQMLAAFLALPAAYFFYWHRDDFLGPRFFYSGIVFLLPLTARSLLEMSERLRGRTFQLGNLFWPVNAGAWVAMVLLLCAGYAVLYGVPQRFRVYATGLPGMKTDIRREARRAGIDGGLVFVKVSWGNRILAKLRSYGVPAGLTVKAYRNVGHCRLDGLLRRASAEGWRTREVSRALASAIVDEEELVRAGRLNRDRTLRLEEGRMLAPQCKAEIRYDQSGYTNYTPHLVANDPDLSGRYVIARDLRSLNPTLLRRYPDRPAFLFDGDTFQPLERTMASDGLRRGNPVLSESVVGNEAPPPASTPVK